MPEERKNRSVRIPKGLKWPYFKQLMDNQIGEYQWVAGFASTEFEEKKYIWKNGARAPLPGQMVFVHWLYDEEKRAEDPAASANTNEFWNRMAETVKEDCRRKREMQMQRRLEQSRPNLSSLGDIMSRATMTEVSSTEMGGNTGPLQKCKVMVQAPLPPDDKTVKFVPERTEYPKIPFEDLVHMLKINLSSPEHQRLTWAKLARMKGIPYFEPRWIR
jgi:hypothetical protein